MKWRCRMVLSGLFMLVTLCRGAAQSEIMRLKSVVLEKEERPGFQKDTSYIDVLNGLAHVFYGINADSAFFYSKKALAYAEKAGYAKGQSESWRMIGNTYEMIGDYAGMLSSYHHSLDIAERINNPSLIARNHLNLSLFYKEVGEYDAALAEMAEVIKTFQQSGDSLQLAYVLNHQSDILLRQQQYDKALPYAEKAVAVATALKDYPSVASFNNELGRILAAKGDYKASLRYHLLAMEYFQSRDDKLGKTETTAFLAETYLLLKNYPEALQFARQSLSLAQEIKRKKEIKEAAKVLADIYAAKGEYQNALQYFKLYKDFSDSLFNEASRKQTFALETRYEYEKKEALLKQEAAREVSIHQNSVRNRNMLIFFAVLVIITLTVLISILLRSREAKQRNNTILQEKNQEISRQKEEMEHQAVQLLLNNQQKDKLFSIIAHDLKGPLNSLKGLLDFLKENSLSDTEIKSMMAELRRNVDYSAELVSNLLFWASSQLDGIVVTPVPVPVHQLITDTMALFIKQASDKAIVLKNECSAAVVVYADKDMIQVVIRNLFSNAIKFCRAGDTITINDRIFGNALEICVEDTGIGIKPEVLEKICRNESVTTYGTAKEKGTGLGMLLCREFVEENKGRFWIESQWGKGSRFYFTIPLFPISSSISV